MLTELRAVIDKDRRLARHRYRVAVTEIDDAPPLQLGAFAIDEHPQFGIVEIIRFHDLAVQHDVGWIAVDDRGNRQFRISWHSHLSDNDKIERRFQRMGDPGRHRHAAAR